MTIPILNLQPTCAHGEGTLIEVDQQRRLVTESARQGLQPGEYTREDVCIQQTCRCSVGCAQYTAHRLKNDSFWHTCRRVGSTWCTTMVPVGWSWLAGRPSSAISRLTIECTCSTCEQVKLQVV